MRGGLRRRRVGSDGVDIGGISSTCCVAGAGKSGAWVQVLGSARVS